jgi:hypothetical protein
MRLPHLLELISPEEHNQTTHDEEWTQMTHSAMETVGDGVRPSVGNRKFMSS